MIRNPHALLDDLATRLADLRTGEDRIWNEAFFRWPRPDEEASQWDAAVARLERELDLSLGETSGLVIAAVENFDTLLATVFKADATEQRLRKWLGRAGNRLMLMATGTRTADIDYDRPLFQAFQSVRLEPWTRDECIDYFNRRRAMEGREKLDDRSEPKARAIADFIGGNPRLAQLLGEVLDTEDAWTVVATMNALADKLADYYRRRIDDLPPLAQGLVDALIRGGEPCSATELARRVGAEQSDIARVMQDLRHADIIRGTPVPDGKETMFRVVDRVFVHYYRLRQLEVLAGRSPLVTIIELLRTFYTRDEQRDQAIRCLDLGRADDAMVFSRLVTESEPERTGRYGKDFGFRLKRYLLAAPDGIGLTADAVMTILDSERPLDLQGCCTAQSDDSSITRAIRGAVYGQMLSRMGLNERAETALQETIAVSADDHAAAFVATAELVFLLLWTGQDDRAGEVWRRFDPDADAGLPTPLMIRAFLVRAVLLAFLANRTNAIVWADRAAELARDSGDRGEQAQATCFKAWSLSQLGRHEEAIAAATEAAALAAEAGDKREQAEATCFKAWSLGQLARL